MANFIKEMVELWPKGGRKARLRCPFSREKSRNVMKNTLGNTFFFARRVFSLFFQKLLKSFSVTQEKLSALLGAYCI